LLTHLFFYFFIHLFVRLFIFFLLFSDENHEEEDHGADSHDSSIDELAMRREEVTDLPETVTKLTTSDGCIVYLVGTAHFSKESQEDVAKVT